MAAILDIPIAIGKAVAMTIYEAPLPLVLAATFTTILVGLAFLFAALFVIAPVPRPPFPSEKKYITSTPTGVSSPQPLSCWHDEWVAHRTKNEKAGDFTDKHTGHIDEAEVALSVIIPAYNEEDRLEIMLEEAVAYLDKTYGRPFPTSPSAKSSSTDSQSPLQNRKSNGTSSPSQPSGYEILLINDGSTDTTVTVALNFSRKNNLHDILRIITLKSNRGKGGAVVHGLRHARGQHAIFADADGASRFSDVAALIAGCSAVADASGRAVAVGSRAHLVGSEAVVKRSWLRNALMHGFHLLLRVLTPRETSRIRDTQCGFKVFTRSALPFIVPYMHAEGWIFDVEMLMLAESAPACDASQSLPLSFSENGRNGKMEGESDLVGEGEVARGTKVRPPSGGITGPGIKVAEVPIQWKEVGGSKLNVLWDSLGMAWGLAVLRASWMVGVYRRR